MRLKCLVILLLLLVLCIVAFKTTTINGKKVMRIKMNPFQRACEYRFAKHKILNAGGGARNGKTTWSVKKMREISMAHENTHIWIGMFDGSQIEKTILHDCWWQIYPKDKVYYNKSEKYLLYPGNRRIDFIHLTDTEDLRNVSLDAFWIEQAELVPENVFWFLTQRISKAGSKGLVTHNPSHSSWVNDVFDSNEEIKDMPAGTKHELTQQEYNPMFGQVLASMYVNRENLDDDYLKLMKTQPKDIYERMVLGKTDATSIRIFPELNRNVHLIKDFPFNPKLYDRVLAIDWGTHNWFAAIFMLFDRGRNCIIKDEYYTKGKTVAEIVPELREKMMSEYPGVDWGTPILDSAQFNTKDQQVSFYVDGTKQHTFVSVAELFKRNGMPCRPAKKGAGSVEAGINAMRAAMVVDPHHRHPFEDKMGAPYFYIVLDNCRQYTRQAFMYKRRIFKDSQLVNRDEDEKPVHKDCDGVDASRYGFTQFLEGPTLLSTAPENSIAAEIERIRGLDEIEYIRG